MTPEATRCTMTQIVMPGHANGAAGVMFGGIMMQWIDVCAGVAAMRLACGGVVTASIDRLDFIHPVRVGDIVNLSAQVNFTSRTSMEVGCRVETEDVRTGDRRYTTKAYLTFVAVDANGHPREVPPLTLHSDDDRRRYTEGARRREERLRAAGKRPHSSP
jgi:acyl-CoA hydrolase